MSTPIHYMQLLKENMKLIVKSENQNNQHNKLSKLSNINVQSNLSK